MTRFVDAGVVIHVVSDGVEVATGHQLLAPTLIRSQVLSRLHERVAAGEVASDIALARLGAAWQLPSGGGRRLVMRRAVTTTTGITGRPRYGP